MSAVAKPQAQPAAATLQIYSGNRSLNPADGWAPFEWLEPVHGPQAKGEVVVIRPAGTSGSLSAGLWRTGPGIAGCEPDGSCVVKYSAPLADETIVILEGSAEITVTATGKRYHIEAGSIMSHPKDLDITWEISAPFLKKFWVLWDSPHAATPGHDLYIGNISDNPREWAPYEWVEPSLGPQVCGELFMIRETGATGTLMCGLWRTGPGIAGCEPDGSSSTPYSAPLGDETMLLLEGQVHLVNEETGEAYDFMAGDVIGLPSGLPVRWTSKGPFVKKFWVITNGTPPMPKVGIS